MAPDGRPQAAAETGRVDPRERLSAVLGPPDPDPAGSDPAAWQAWVEETVLGPGPPGPATAEGELSGAAVAGPARLLHRWVPESLRGARVDPGRRRALVLVAAATLAAVVVAVWVWGSRPVAEPVAGLPAVATVAAARPDGASAPAAPATEEASAGPTAQASQSLVVSVTGKVARPGLVTVPGGARVADVLAAAGGPLPGVDVAGLNLARKVTDGEQVAVGVPAAPDALPAGAAVGGAAAAGDAAASAAGPIDLNAATPVQLDALPGVGPVTAQHIIDWRTHNGRFARVEQLREVDGIGERRFEQLRSLVRV